jgi:hypothetical protein
MKASAPPQAKSHAVLGQISDMDLRLLRVFKAVVDCGGMAAAELELNIGTSTYGTPTLTISTRSSLNGLVGIGTTTDEEDIARS